MKAIRASLLAVALAMASVPSIALAIPPPQGGGTEPQSFGRPVTHLGMSELTFYAFTEPGEPCDASIALCMEFAPVGSSTVLFEPEVTSVVIPAGSTHALVWPVFHELAQYQLYNGTAAPVDGFFRMRVIVTLESDALRDPALINPDTGLPFDGKYTFIYSPTEGENRSLQPGERIARQIRHSSTGNSAFDYQTFQALGVPDSVIKKIFQGEITMHVGVRVDSRHANSVLGNFTMRLFGD